MRVSDWSVVEELLISRSIIATTGHDRVQKAHSIHLRVERSQLPALRSWDRAAKIVIARVGQANSHCQQTMQVVCCQAEVVTACLPRLDKFELLVSGVIVASQTITANAVRRPSPR